MKLKLLMPIFFGFFVMGFCDVVGIASSYVKLDFALSDTEANFLPSMLFIWFFVFSVPVGLLMNRIGRKNMVLISMAVTAAALVVPFVHYSYASCLVAFALLGIGNTIIQVSLNPLLANVTPSDKLTSALTAGQFVKALSAFCGPIIAAVALTQFGDWKLIFPIFCAITLFSMLWLWFTPIDKEEQSAKGVTLRATLSLLARGEILLLFIGIISIVGVDVGMNTMIPRLIMERTGVELSDAGYGTSLYFALRTAGTFLGAFLLVRFAPVRFYRWSSAAALLALCGLFFASSSVMIYSLIAVIGFAIANIFSIILGRALEQYPQSANQLSSLMIMGVAGGALIPPVMGVLCEAFGSQSGSLVAVGVCMTYLLVQSLRLTSAR